MSKEMIKIPSESIFYSFIKKHSPEIKEVIKTHGPEYYIGSDLVAKVEHSVEESSYYANERIISDVRIQEKAPLSDTEIHFINEALSGDIIYVVNIMNMKGTPTQSIYEEAKSRGLRNIGKEDFFIQRTRIIQKEEFITN